MSDYAPFPTLELKQLGDWHTNAAKVMPDDSIFHNLHMGRAAVCQNAVASHDALRDRCLLAELNLRSAEALLQAKGIAFQRAEVNAENSHAA